ncbi:MAG: redox-sensing transcriptional repressor Rex [Spirochaetales bacterium]|nr:redox-sensing transcriptional repressor Rex [Spirochaetales bacterium]
MKEDLNKTIPLPTIRRMPNYLRVTRDFLEAGKEWISTTDFSDILGLKPIQVRKDLAFTGLAGKPRLGFEVSLLIKAINDMLGWNNSTDAILVGSGALGSAILGFKGFAEHGLNIVAAFDANPALVGREIHGKTVFSLDKMDNLVKRMGITMGIITVPEAVGQETADRMVKAGIKGIWNFCPVTLRVPEDVTVQREDLSSGLAVLSVKLSEAR